MKISFFKKSFKHYSAYSLLAKSEQNVLTKNNMKKLLCYLALLGLIIITGCRKENKNHVCDTTALRNGDEWEANSITFQHRLFPEYFNLRAGTDISDDRDDKLDIHKIPYKTGIHYMYRGSAIENDSLVGADYYTYIGGDQITGSWSISEIPDSSNYIHITFYDECTRKVEGTFNCTLVGTSFDGTAPDTIRFTDGRFEGKISEE